MANLNTIFDDLKYYFGTGGAREMRRIVEENKVLASRPTIQVGVPGVDFGEYTMQGDEWQQHTMAKYLGDFNPDNIPLATYDSMRWDGQLRLGLMTVKMPIMSRAFWVECKDKDIKAFVYQNLEEIWRPYIKGILTALDFGFAPFEKVWEIAEEYRIINEMDKIDYTRDVIKYKSLKDLCQKTITIDYTDKMKFNGFYQNKNRQHQAFVKPDKAFIFTHDKEWGNVYGWSRLKPAYPYWFTYWVIDAWHERWLQKRGIPPIIAKYPVGKSQTATSGTTPTFKDNQEIAKNAAKSLQSDSVVTIPSEEIKSQSGVIGKWSLESFEDKSRIDAFVQAKEMLDTRKLRAILVPERAITQDSSVGSYKSAEAHLWIMMESLKGLIGDIANHTNDFLIPQLVEVNFGKKAPRATLQIEEVGRELTSAMYEIYLGMVMQGKAYPGVKKMEQLLNIPAETDEEKAERVKREQEFGILPGGGGIGVPQGIPHEAPYSVKPDETRFFDGRMRRLSERIWMRL